MKLLIYLRFLRPLRSLKTVAFYTGIGGWAFGQTLFHLDPKTAWLIALAVALPLLLGIFIAGAAHEPMHRPFALLLPGIRERQRAAATVSVLIAALATTCGAAWASPSVSPPAIFGLACALISFPCIDRHQVLGGLGSGLASVAIWLFTCLAVGPNLGPTLNCFPWIFLLGGLAISTICQVNGFLRESLRSRAHTPFIAYQTIFCSYLFHRGMVARWQAEISARRTQSRQGSSATGRDWKVHSVGPTSFDWMRVFWHANFGGRKRGSFVGVQMTFAIMTLINAAIASGIACMTHHHQFWDNLARLAAPELMYGIPLAMLQPGMIVLCALALPLQRLAYPISRERLARVEFWQITVQSAAALVIITASILLASLIGQFVSGKLLAGYGLPALLTVDLQMAVLLPLFVAAGKLRRPSFRILAGIPIVAAMMLTVFTTSHWIDRIFTLPGVLLLLIAIAFSQWVLWRRLHRLYATTDMVVGTSFTSPLLLGTATPR